jgi:type VI secretion system protein ImpH
METGARKDFARLIEDLKTSGPQYSVFRAIYLAEKLSKAVHPDRDDEKLDQKGLRFRPYEQYVFPSRDIHSFEWKDETMSFVLTFMGLYGIDSPLPRCYHEQVAQQQSIHGAGNVPLQNFLDMFNNRFYWLYYQAWKKYRYFLQFKDEPYSRIVERIFSFAGLSYQRKSAFGPIPRFKWLRLSSILSHRIRNKSGLLLFLQEFFPEIKFGLKEYIPRRVELEERPKLGHSFGEYAFRLSRNSVIGGSKIDYMGRVCLDIGPMDFTDYLEFTPGSQKLTLLRDLLDIYLNDGLEYDMRFIIRSSTIQRLPLADRRQKLGLSCWIGKPRDEFVEVYYKAERLGKSSH